MGSNAFLHANRHELETLIDCEIPCTIWYALSAADNHWMDLYKLLYGNKSLPDISDPIKNVWWKWNTSSRFPSIVDMFFFCKRVDNLLAFIFADWGLSCKWWWKDASTKKEVWYIFTEFFGL